MDFSEDQIAADAMLSAYATEVYMRLLKFFASKSEPADKVAAALGVLVVAAGACKAAKCDRDRFVSMAADLYDKTVVITPEQALDMLTHPENKH